ncbi:hypothetical protein THRCLA_20786 [Thraustotheca clavata]|uniref:Transmembrane protein n=1 Tax=Thraustotheca clavata TaxID=74557 RepID=A0A1W0A3G8_9STRA|nr:hypothetical protein THRCLA_20786 [Thraustotheca clavata]
MGLVLHKRERRNLLFIGHEAVVSTEDIIMYCQQVYLNICALLALFGQFIYFACYITNRTTYFGAKYAFALTEDLFLLAAQVIWFYTPAYITVHCYRSTGNIIRHYAKTIWNAYPTQENLLAVYGKLGHTQVVLCRIYYQLKDEIEGPKNTIEKY